MPIFFGRYKDLILTYTFLRERIINNNSIDSYEKDPTYGHNLDLMYRDKSLQIENDINNIKINFDQIVKPLSVLT